MNAIQTVVELFFKGGIFMWPLLACAITGIVLVIERFLFLRDNRVDWDRLQFELRSLLKNNELDKAIALAAKTPGIVGRVLHECLLRVQNGERNVETASEKEILNEMASMHKSRGWLATIIQISPLLGLIGTVQGMIMVFMQIEASATVDPRMLGAGIYTKLITTFTGLLIVIPLSVAQEEIRKRTNDILHHLDLCLVEVREWLDEQQRREEGRPAGSYGFRAASDKGERVLAPVGPGLAIGGAQA